MIMNKCRRASGQALTLTIVSALVLVIVGVGLIYLMQIFGGSGEQKNATDGGVLNLNKTAAGQTVVLSPSYLNQHQFIAMYGKSSGLIGNDGSMRVSLATFNNMIGSALMVAMNASADGMSGSTGGQTNASNVIKDLEVSTDSVGGQLKKVLETTDTASGDWESKAFNSVALVNSARMLGKDAQASWDKSQYQVAYLISPTSESAASNVSLDQFVSSNMPYTYDDSGNMKPFPAPKSILTDKGNYLRGYQAINIPKIDCPIYAVPTQPGQQPHLVSLVTFAQSQQQPGANVVLLPPNAFKGGAITKNEISSSNQNANAAGIVGMPTGATQASIPHGFIIIDNSMNPRMSPIAVPTGDTWDAVEACTGTLVYRPSRVFSTEGIVNGRPYNALSSWLQTARSGNFNPESGPAIVDDDGNALLYDGNGSPITSKAEAAKQIPFDTNPGNTVLATNQNSDPNGASPDSDCVALATPTLPDNLSPFNKAYHPNANVPSGTSSGSLICAEQAKVYVLDLYKQYRLSGNQGGSFIGKTFPETGLRLYPDGLPSSDHPYAYAPADAPASNVPLGDFRVATYGDPGVLGKVTKDGTMRNLIEQTTVAMNASSGSKCSTYIRVDGDSSHATKVSSVPATTPAAEMRNFLKQRMNEIHPNVSDSDVDRVFTQTLPLGTTFYVYYQGGWVVAANPPSWINYIPTPDGIRHAFTHAYSVSGSVVDAAHDFGSNDYPFNTNNVNAQAVDCVSYQSSSGANGLLGYIKFFEQVVMPGQ